MVKIIHVDMDAFFASVEKRDNPELRLQAIAVGGKPESRGVVATACYEARKYGVRSAMPMATAVRLCPNLQITPPRGSVYREVSTHIRGIFARYTDLIEPLSIDEAYLDVSNNFDFKGSATLLARHILDTIFIETELTASAGVSYCKFLAKYASNINKPNGIFTVTPTEAPAIIDAMQVEQFHGIGPATQKRLNNLSIYTGKDLRQANLACLKSQLGKTADFYYRLAQGEDNREIRTNRVRKSLGSEITFNQDISDRGLLLGHLLEALYKTWKLLDERELRAMTVTVKIKYHDFTLQTKRHTEITRIETLASAEIVTKSLLQQANPDRPVRLVGMTFSQLREKKNYPIQLRLFD